MARSNPAGLLTAFPVAAAIAGLSVLLAACGGAPSASVANIGSTKTAPVAGSSAQLEKLVSCMRSHGVPDFPDLVMTPNGPALPVGSTSNIDKNSPKVQAARVICQKFAPPSQPGPPDGPTITPKDQLDYLKASACMRTHGFPDFPDPVFSGGTVSFPPPPAMNASIGNSPPFLRAQETCGKLIPSGLPHSTQSGSGQ